MCWIFSSEKWALETALRVLSRKGVVLVVGGGCWGGVGGGLWPCVIFQEGAAHSITPPPPPPTSSTDYCHAFYKPPPTQMIKRPWSWLDPIMLTLDRRCKRRQRSFVGSWNARPVAGGMTLWHARPVIVLFVKTSNSKSLVIALYERWRTTLREKGWGGSLSLFRGGSVWIGSGVQPVTNRVYKGTLQVYFRYTRGKWHLRFEKALQNKHIL